MTRNQYRRRLGFTLLEIMTSVTLALMLMYAVARIFSRVGGTMNETTSTMEMTNALRNAKNRLTLDLESISTSPKPPRNSRNNEGYLCYVEGLGGPFTRVAANGPFSVGDIALDTERFQAKGADDPYDYCDNTVGDLDDILSFTAKAPDGQAFRGRYIAPIYGVDSNGNYGIINGEESTFESQYAEIIWFVRGTTLYRRVLPVIPDKMLQDSFDALQCASLNSDGNLAGVAYQNIEQGFGFFRFYDASVHMESERTKDASGNEIIVGKLVANTLGDLTNRANRYFYWNSCGLHLHPDVSTLDTPYAKNIHGSEGAWYWLRMATLQESAAPNFRAGAPFGQNSYARDAQPTNGAGRLYTAARRIGSSGSGIGLISDYWKGESQTLQLHIEADETRLPQTDYYCNALPLKGSDAERFPFLDYWNSPNPWDEVNYETGDLASTVSDYSANSDKADLTFNQDVVLTNVISFNVKAWDPDVCAYVDLGSNVASMNSETALYDANNLRSYGRYGKVSTGNATDLWLPCVYDTWTEQYQRDLYMYDDYYKNRNSNYNVMADSGATLADIEAEGTISASQLKDYPPPYNVRLNSLQIEIRVFDPRSKNIRNAVFDVDLSSL